MERKMSNTTLDRAVLLCAILLLSGCDAFRQPKAVTDQKLRREIFFQCLGALPKGPERVSNSNDWDEVVSECGRQAYQLSTEYK